MFQEYLDAFIFYLKIIGIKILYNIIYIYSACQIKCNQGCNYLLPYFKGDDQNDSLKIEQFDISANKLTNILEKDLSNAVKNTLFNILYIATNIKNGTVIANKLIIDKKCVCLEFDMSNITFIALYLNYNDMRYNINLKTDEFNYYLVGNVIDKDFIQYYINTVLNLKFSYVESEILSYQLELIDNDVKMLCLNAEQSIIIEKDGYKIA